MLYPMFFMVILTVLVGLITVTCRINSVRSGSVKIKYYTLMEGGDVPEIITKTSRCFNNMFEVPVLFYVVATLFISLDIESPLAIVMAWSFVGFRCTQAYIHLTYNNVLHRMFALWFALLCVLVMWITLVMHQT